MSGVDLQDLKSFARAEGFSDDDGILQTLLLAAEATVLDHVRRDLNTEFGGIWPEPCCQAVRLLVVHWYENRHQTAQGDATGIPAGVRDILAPYRDLS